MCGFNPRKKAEELLPQAIQNQWGQIVNCAKPRGVKPDGTPIPVLRRAESTDEFHRQC